MSTRELWPLHLRFLTFFAQIAIYGMGTCSILGMALCFTMEFTMLTNAEVVIGGAGHHVEEVPHKVTNFLKVS
jgi:hypothetical protein